MNPKMNGFVGLVAMIFAQAAAAQGCPTAVKVADRINSDTGHYYEVYRADGISWACAKAHAEALKYGDIPGHLATITSSGEDAFVDQLRTDSLSQGLTQPQVWVGGYQEAAGAEPSGGWRWDNGEGPFPGANTEPAYANWAVGEPNNAGGNEEHLTIGRFGPGGGWNDEGAAIASIGGFIVEYDVPRSAACQGTACQTIQGHTLIFPQGSFEGDDAIRFSAYEFTDPRVTSGVPSEKCGVAPLTLFTDANDGKPELRIPPYLCGSPKFVVIAVDSSDLDIFSGTVFVENDTGTVLPDNLYKECNDPIPQDSDPQYQDVVVWQSTDPAGMLEDGLGTGLFDGAAGEFTNACGSSVARVRGASYYVVGMHIDFGSGYTWAGNSAGNHQKFIELTTYKLSVLLQSVADAKAAGALKNGEIATKMTAQLTNAVTKLNRGDPAGALVHVNKFLTFVDVGNYRTVASGFNYNGDHLMRGTNIQFMLRVKVIPYAP